MPLPAACRGAHQRAPVCMHAAAQVAALLNILTYWCLAIPLAYHLAFTRSWGLTGLWVGAATANYAQAAAMAVIALR